MSDLLTERRPAPTSDDAAGERERIIAAAIEAYRRTAFHLVTLEVVAARADLALDVVQQHFEDLDALMMAVTATWYTHRMSPIIPIAERVGAVAFLRAVVVANIADPALMRYLSALVNVAATADHPMSPLLQQQWLRFHALVHRTLAADVALEREPATIDVARGAEQLVALYEGLQLQSLVRPTMDLLPAYDRAVTRLREGWRRPYEPPVWEI